MQLVKFHCTEPGSRVCTDERLHSRFVMRNHYIYLLQQLKKITVEKERATFLGMQCHPLQLMVMSSCKIHGNNAAVLSVCVSEDHCICMCVLRYARTCFISQKRQNDHTYLSVVCGC